MLGVCLLGARMGAPLAVRLATTLLTITKLLRGMVPSSENTGAHKRVGQGRTNTHSSIVAFNQA